MTSQEIKTTRSCDKSANDWLKEIAFQLAIANERNAPLQPEPERVIVREIKKQHLKKAS